MNSQDQSQLAQFNPAEIYQGGPKNNEKIFFNQIFLWTFSKFNHPQNTVLENQYTYPTAIEKPTKTMPEAQEKNHTDPIDLSSRTPLGQLMRRAVTYMHQAGADGSTTPLLSRKKFSLFLGPPSYYVVPSDFIFFVN